MTNSAKFFVAQRLHGDDLSMLSRWFAPDGSPLCFCLEPGFDRLPHPGIPSGSYSLKLRTAGEKHKKYLKWYGPDFHKGMIEIADVPGRTAILFHVGNSISDTDGCSCCGEVPVDPKVSVSHHWEVARSRVTYERIYPILRDAILSGGALLDIRMFSGAMA